MFIWFKFKNKCLFIFLFFISTTVYSFKKSDDFSNRITEIISFLPLNKSILKLRLPSYSKTNKLNYLIESDKVTKISIYLLHIKNLKIRKYLDKKIIDSEIFINESVYNVKTKILTSKTKPKIYKKGMAIRGNKIILNVETQKIYLKGDTSGNIDTN